MKKLFLICIAAFLLFISCNETFEVQKCEENLEYINAYYEVPFYKNYPDVSEQIKNIIGKDYQNYKQEALEDWEHYHSDVFTYRNKIEDFSNSKYLNIFVTKYIFAGEGLEDEYIITFTYDKKLKKFVDIQDVTGRSVKEISDYVKLDLSSRYNDLKGYSKQVVESSIEENAIPDEKKYTTFIALKDKTVLYFAPEQILPKGYGVQTVEIKR